MTYSAAQTEPLAQRLVADLPGLNINVARAWIRAESGTGNNPLGVTVNGQLATYATPEQGIDAAAARIQLLPIYGGIRAAVQSDNPKTQALAITASPWNKPNSGYYFNQFNKAGLFGTLDAHQQHLLSSGDIAGLISALGGVPAPLSGPVGGTPTGGTGGGANTPSSFSLLNIIKQADPADYPISPTTATVDSGTIEWLHSVIPASTPGADAFFAGVKPGMLMSQVQVPNGIATAMAASLNVSGFQNLWGGVDPGQGVPGAADPFGILALGGTIVSVFTYLAALAVVALGIYLYSKGNKGGQVDAAPAG